MPTNFSRISERAFQVLSTRPDPLGVLSTTARVNLGARKVAIDLRRIESVAQVLSLRELPIPAWNYNHHFFDSTEKTLTYLFLLDALNFSFWGEPRWSVTIGKTKLDGYWALAASLKRAASENERVLDANFLAEVSPRELLHSLRGRGTIPMLVERWRNVQELGRVLRDHFGGHPARVVSAAEQDAPRLAQIIAEHFSSFNDTTVHEQHAVNFFKRAQLVVADIWGAFGGKGWGEFRNLSDLTAFADYKLPQILRAWGILKYSPSLARRVDQKRELMKDGTEEIEIRAATLWAVEFLREALAKRGRVVTSVQMDWFLWQSSQGAARGKKPYHRVRTIYY